MAIYSYKGMDKSGKEIKSTITSESLSIAKSKIRTMGVMLLEIKEQKSQSTPKSGGSSFSFGQGVSTNELALMTRQLATLVKAKIQIVEALNALVEQSDSPKLKLVLSEVKQKVNEGSSLAHALADYPKIFNTVYVNMVEAGEASGTLQIVLLRLADFTEAQVKLRLQIKKAMTYPIIIASLGVIMMSIILMFVIPKISRIFTSTRRELPWQTEVSIWLSNFLVNNWYFLVPGLIIGWLLFLKYISTVKGKKVWHRVLLKTPVIGELTMMINVSRFCSSLATLLNSGVPILTSMRIVKNLVANVHMQQAIEESRITVSEGASLTGPLIKSQLFPPMVTHMIKLGEKSGELEPMLQIVAENYEDQVETKLSGLTSFIEPIMMVIMGLAVAFIIFSVVVPIMELNNLS
jgi:general secretion pathway protein F